MGQLNVRPLESGEAFYSRPWPVEGPSNCFFYHSIELPGFGLQEGAWDLRGRFDEYVGGVDLTDKRVLDVGTATGFLTFEAEARGAREVVSFDLDDAKRQDLLPFAGSAYMRAYDEWRRDQNHSFDTWKRGYWLSHRLLRSRAKVFYGDIYDMPERLGGFDVVVLGAVLEHLVDPLSAIKSVSRLATDVVVINTDYLETDAPLAMFNGRASIPESTYIFWTYSISLYDEYMAILGFEPVAQRKSAFAGTRSAPGEPRPLLDRVALVYRRRSKLDPRGSS